MPEFSDEELIQVCENVYLGSFENDEVAPLRFADEKLPSWSFIMGLAGFQRCGATGFASLYEHIVKKAGIDKKPLI